MVDTHYHSLVGHTTTLEQLRDQVQSASLAHALIFIGPKFVGKETLAYTLAQSIVADGVGAIEVLSGGSVDVDDLRQSLRTLSYSAFGTSSRVLIIADVDELSSAAQQLLLKSLEEPVEGRHLLLTASLSERVLPTVWSRLVRVPVGGVDSASLHRAFARVDVPEFFFDLGLPGLFFLREQDGERFERYQYFLGKLFRLGAASLPERFELAKELASLKEEGVVVLALWLEWLANRPKVSLSFLRYALETLLGMKSGLNFTLHWENIFLAYTYER